IGQGADSIAVRYRSDLTSFRATQAAAQAAYRMAGFGAERVEVAELHDAFTPFELISLADTGLVPPGKAGLAPLGGRTAVGRCPRCRRLVVPPASLCPDHPVKMEAATLPPLGEVVSFTTLHSPPEGFRAPLHLALVQLEGGARLFCHGAATDGVKIGSHVSVE